MDEVHLEKARQSLLDRQHFNFKEEETADESDAENDCNRIPKLNKCESKSQQYKHNLR